MKTSPTVIGLTIMDITIDITGLTGKFISFPANLTKSIRKEMKNQIESVAREARKFHRYGLSNKRQRLTGKYGKASRGYIRTGMLEKSTLSSVNENGSIAQAYLESGIAHYGVYVHEGHGAPGKSVKNGYPYVWEPDRFLDSVMKRHEPYIQPAIEKAVIDALRMAGL